MAGSIKASSDFPCVTCALRQAAEARPQSFKARLWRWHTKICPGWKGYQAALRREGKA
jgi:hypothetical protein